MNTRSEKCTSESRVAQIFVLKNAKVPARSVLRIPCSVSMPLICFQPYEQFFSYLAAVTIASGRAANLDLCLALTAFNSEGSFTCHTYCDTGPPILRSYPKDP
jgi:hypothetical protein